MLPIDDVIKYHSFRVYPQIFYWETLIEKDIGKNFWDWQVKDGTLGPEMTKLFQLSISISMYFDENTNIIPGTDREGK